ncbi:alpha/beta fold hydrolase [Paenibacillus oryzisoli]|uniref:Carboxymethylenebutenolidase n=1 Tax=Paenibacillus oryzisoli TaxID=1850517 RepID=A0A197ZVU3_9BACL|nr:alpha/beta fold hydrolase [Paenibacillus oryzisoli]OAS13329.1 carboxymethylenebutenolidase [Paenibacillus oryzisoli]
MKKWIKITLLSLLSLIVILAAAFLIYVSNYYHAVGVDKDVLANEKTITTDGKLTILTPSTPSETGFIFYPGGKVEHTAYLPMLEKLRQNGITCVLVDMPFNLAFFNSSAADKVFGKLPAIHNWYIGGHSLGGAMASNYASKHPDKIKGLVLLGAYIYGDIPPSNALTVYGSLDSVLDKSKISYTENVFVIEGGNHGQFGNYGAQKGDGTATISSEQQQQVTVEQIMKFIQSKDTSS